MVDYSIQPVQIPNFAAGIGNAMDDRYKINLEMARSNRLNEQADIERQKFLIAQQAHANALANTAASKAAVTNALSNSVVGLPGEAAGPYMPSVQRATNALALQGRTTEANTLSNFLEQQAKQKQAENTAEQGGIKISADKLNLENSTLQQAQAEADRVSSPEELLALNAAIHSDKSPLRDMFDRMGIDANTSQAKLQEAIQTQGFDAARAMFAQGAAKAAEAHSKELQSAATLAGTQATTANTVQTGQQNATKFNAPVPKEINLGGRVAIIDSNPQSPTFNQELSSLGTSAQPREATMPPGYRMAANGTSMEVIPGGPADAKQLAAANVKLEPGQRMTSEGNIEDVPGSRLYVKNSKAHAGDSKNVQLVNATTDSTFSDIDKILDPKKAADFDANFGYGSTITSKTPGARDVATKLESIKAALKEAGLTLFRSGGSIGAMTEKEWPIVQDRIASLNNSMSPDEARRTLADIKNRMDRIRNITNDTYDTQWGATQYHKPELTKNSTTNIFNAADAIIGGK